MVCVQTSGRLNCTGHTKSENNQGNMRALFNSPYQSLEMHGKAQIVKCATKIQPEAATYSQALGTWRRSLLSHAIKYETGSPIN